MQNFIPPPLHKVENRSCFESWLKIVGCLQPWKGERGTALKIVPTINAEIVVINLKLIKW